MNTIVKKFLSDDFLLNTETARYLYHRYASPMPIIDYHNHLSPADIATNRKFKNITEIWLEGDHYKWRAMRTNGISETYITGDATPKAKFMKWATTVPSTIRNPLYHWTHLELKNYFGITDLLNEDTATHIYEKVNEYLNLENYHVQGLLAKMNVEIICTTDDPVDPLNYHDQLSDSEAVRMYPTFRPDKVYQFHNVPAYLSYLDKLGETAGKDINSLQNLLTALDNRINFFQSKGCRAADHGLEFLPFERISEEKAKSLFLKIRSGKSLQPDEQLQLRSTILQHLSKSYHRVGWVQQFHLGALRNNNTRLAKKLGPDTGFDSIGDFEQAITLAGYLNHLDSTDQLTKTILYNLNPADNELFASMVGNFNDGSTAGKVQYGAAWWFLDQKDGIEKQINALSSLGLLSRFIGMVTDSRSFMSFPRHEYFRRILCAVIGNEVEAGELPDDEHLLGNVIESVCYYNAKHYFNF
ncbi:MAG: glucuronate isomerase [Sediminibacterium sp.]